MNGKINIDLKSLKLIFNKNKSNILPVVIILVSIILFFQFVIPQYQILLTTRKQAKEASLKLATLKANLDMLTNINENTLDLQLKTLNSALPLEKDFIGILNSIYSTAQKTGVELGSFSFKVGDLSTPENSNGFSIVKLSIPINAGIMAVNSFVEVISNTLPLSEVNFVKVGKMSSTVDLSFYYMPLNTSGYSQDARISPISQRALTLINQLNKFQNISFSEPSEPTPTMAPSMSPITPASVDIPTPSDIPFPAITSVPVDTSTPSDIPAPDDTSLDTE